uniref:Cell adhesion molecule 2 n=1 Tax=Cacopsylla melanoneura TaxID=428564 RepID=A0A8D8Z899_9HEMI
MIHFLVNLALSLSMVSVMRGGHFRPPGSRVRRESVNQGVFMVFTVLLCSARVLNTLPICTEEEARRHNGNTPYFEDFLPNLVIGQEGGHVSLPCVVCKANQKSVAWIRKSDVHIVHLLQVNRNKFYADKRFHINPLDSPDEFSLEIQNLQPRDSGLYECQVPMEPKKLSRVIDLKVIVPNATIIPGPKMIVKAGSQINMTCYMTLSKVTPDLIFWFHNGSRVMDNNKTNILTITQERGNYTMKSTLTIQNAREDHTGNYTCINSMLNATSTYVHVIRDVTSHFSKNDVTSTHPTPLHLIVSMIVTIVIGLIFCPALVVPSLATIILLWLSILNSE